MSDAATTARDTFRIIVWNINGIRTLPKYHPWNLNKTFEETLKALDGDITCVQELKSCRANTERHVAVPGVYDAFLSFPVTKGGYSGVGVFTNSQTALPLKAEEGLSGRLQTQQLKPLLTPEERVSSTILSPDDIDLVPDAGDIVPSDLMPLDSEGRALMLDMGLFVLINVYCPNETSDARLPFKMNYHLMLQERVRTLVAAGREVMVVGDMNICATPLDHCDGHLPSNAQTFWEHPARAWFREWLEPRGTMTDVLRRFWPERKGMYTVWNQKIGGRETNYGTRVDYILVTPGLMPWIKAADIQASVKGSDHCPIYVDLYQTLPDGSRTLREAMQMSEPRTAPRLAAKYWDEYSGKQQLLSNFFGKGGNPPPTQPTIKSPSSTLLATASAAAKDIVSPVLATPSSTRTPKPPASPVLSKRKSTDHVSGGAAKKAKTNEQKKLSSFFAKPKSSSPPPSNAATMDVDEQEDADYRLAVALSQEDAASQTRTSPVSNAKSKAAWSQLMAPIEPPRCIVHNEAAKEWTTNKPGQNKGKTFYLCSRPVGPGYDKGKSERLREEVNHEYRCNFFKWASEVKRDALRASSSGAKQ